MSSTLLKSSNGYIAFKDRTEIGIKSYSIKGTSTKIACAETVVKAEAKASADAKLTEFYEQLGLTPEEIAAKL